MCNATYFFAKGWSLMKYYVDWLVSSQNKQDELHLGIQMSFLKKESGIPPINLHLDTAEFSKEAKLSISHTPFFLLREGCM